MRNVCVLAVALFALCPSRAHALNWSLGANLGFTVIDPVEDGDALTTFGWPSAGILNVVGTPGLRIGFAGEGAAAGVFIETSWMSLSSSGSSLTTATFTGNGIYAFPVSGSVQPFVTAGVGVAHFGDNDFFFTDASANSAIFGGGLGVQHRLGHGHGTLRAEVHYDHVSEGTDNGGTLIPATNNIGLKLGFDLWMR